MKKMPSNRFKASQEKQRKGKKIPWQNKFGQAGVSASSNECLKITLGSKQINLTCMYYNQLGH